jgi:hypothetical protein
VQAAVMIMMYMQRFLKAIEIETTLHPNPNPYSALRVLKLEQISWTTNFSFDARDILPGLEILHITWCERLSRKSAYPPLPAAKVCQMMARFVRVSRKSLKSLKLGFGRNECAMRGFDVMMLGTSATDEDHDGDEGKDEDKDNNKVEGEKDWKQLVKLRLTMDVDRTKSISPMGKNLVGTLEAIAEIFPNLGTLELILDPNRYYHDMYKYTVSVHLLDISGTKA